MRCRPTWHYALTPGNTVRVRERLAFAAYPPYPLLRAEQFPNSNLEGVANLLIMPNLDAAHIAMNLIKTGADGVPIGPILMGCDIPAHIVTPGTTVRGLVNMTATAAARIASEDK